jgi:peptidoglycan/xylan/chitin deacetylase (PgdA/CDA1 family)
MKGKRLLLAQVLYRSHCLDVLRRAAGRRLIVFNYHRIRSDDVNFSTPFDDEVYGPSASQFEQQINWLRRNTNVLSEDALIDLVKSGRPPSYPSALVTFDDGYRDNYTIAYPILKRLGVPAIFFIPTQQIMMRQLGWWDIIAYLIKNTSRPALRFDGEEILVANSQTAAIRKFLSKMKLEPHEKSKNLLVRLAEECAVPLPDPSIQDGEMMTWEQIRELPRNEIAVGSHAHSHCALATMPPAMQKQEMTASKAILERELGSKVRSISYPVGNYQHFTAESQALAAQCGFELGFSFNTGVNYGGSIAPFDVKRVDPPDQIELLAAMTVLPQLFARRE